MTQPLSLYTRVKTKNQQTKTDSFQAELIKKCSACIRINHKNPVQPSKTRIIQLRNATKTSTPSNQNPTISIAVFQTALTRITPINEQQAPRNATADMEIQAAREFEQRKRCGFLACRRANGARRLRRSCIFAGSGAEKADSEARE
ncbi:hypothetical protein ACLOJK_018322 [Asimina triloba]